MWAEAALLFAPVTERTKKTDTLYNTGSGLESSAQPIQLPLSEPVDPSLFDSVARLSMPDALGGMAFVGLTPSAHTITLDTDREHGGLDSGPQPLELLLAALGSCTAMDVLAIMRKKRQRVTHYSVNVFANTAPDYPKTYTHIYVEHVIGGEGVDPRAMARSLELSITKYCPVHALLARATRVEHAYRILDTMLGDPLPGADV